ncbi:MAG: hypothetical protein EWV61_14245 [Microcystis aeruginosa Ma_AC_P_19900807_S300]|nr:MAG: hypothetical protein EWV61_14245 [Microcystis aeruginosa Ma_AC_P_19900807_S300]
MKPNNFPEYFHNLGWVSPCEPIGNTCSIMFGLCYAMDGGYKGWNPYIERYLAIFVNYFLSKAN